MNWIAEGVNVVGQGLLLVGAVLLHQAGLREMELCAGHESSENKKVCLQK